MKKPKKKPRVLLLLRQHQKLKLVRPVPQFKHPHVLDVHRDRLQAGPPPEPKLRVEPPQQLHNDPLKRLAQPVPPTLLTVDKPQAPRKLLPKMQKPLRVCVVKQPE